MVADLNQSTSISPPEQHSALLDSAFGRLDKKESRKTLWLLIATLNLAFPDHDFSRVAADEFRREDSAKAVLVNLTSALTNVRASGSHIPIYRSLSNYHSMSTSLPVYMPSSAANAAKGKGSTPRSRRSAAVSPGKGSFAPGVYSSSTTAASVVVSRLAALIGENGPGSTSDNNVPGDLPSQPLIRQVLDPIIQLGDCEVFSYTPDIDSDPHAYPSDDDYGGGDDDEQDGFYRGSGSDKGDTEMADDDMMVASYPSKLKMVRSRIDGVVGAAPYLPQQYRASSSEQDQWRSFSQAPLTRMQRGEDSRNAFPFGMDGFASDSDRSTSRYYRDGSADSDEVDETGGLLWSSNHFFYNKKMRRIVFISCWGRKAASSSTTEPTQVGKTNAWQPLAGSAMLPGQGLSKSMSPLKRDIMPLPFAHLKRDVAAEVSTTAESAAIGAVSSQPTLPFSPPQLQRTESEPVLRGSSVFATQPTHDNAIAPSAVGGTPIAAIRPSPAQRSGSGRHRPRYSRSGASGRKSRRGDSSGKPSPAPSAQSYRDRSPQKHSHPRQNRKHYTTPPASGPSTPSVLSQRSHGSVPPSPAVAVPAPTAPPAAAAVSIMPGSSILPPAIFAAQVAQMSSPQSQDHTHGTSHRRQKRRTSNHGGTPSDRRRRTAHVTPPVKLA